MTHLSTSSSSSSSAAAAAAAAVTAQSADLTLTLSVLPREGERSQSPAGGTLQEQDNNERQASTEGKHFASQTYGRATVRLLMMETPLIDKG